MELDNKKKGLLFIVGAGVIGLILLVILLVSSGSDEKTPERTVTIDVDMPDPSVNEIPDTKLEAYSGRERSNKSIEDYWDSVGNNSDEDPLEELNSGQKRKNPEKKSSIINEVSYDELFGSSSSNSQNDYESRKKAREQERKDRYNQMKKDQDEMLDRLQEMYMSGQPKESQAENPQDSLDAPMLPERDKIDVESVKIVRSGGISSIDDEFGGMSDTGLSSLDGDDKIFTSDESYPFKCMFVRQEKLKSSQRVTLRLLEDIVVEGQLVRKNTHLNAICTINDRIDLKVSSIDIGGRIINLNFEAYDNDGTKGIYAPDLENDSMVEDAMKQAGLNAGRRRMSSLVGQTVQDLVSAGSLVITGKGKDRTVTIPSGYQFYLVKKKKL